MTTALRGLTAFSGVGFKRQVADNGPRCRERFHGPILPGASRARRAGMLGLLTLMAWLTWGPLMSSGRCLAFDAAPANCADDPADGKQGDAVPQSRMAIRAIAADGGETLSEVAIEFHGTINNGRVNLNLTSDENGLTEFPWPKGATVQNLWMTARKAGYVPVHFMWQSDVRPIALPEEIELKFETGREIGGLVQSDSGKPIAGAQIRLTLPITWPRLESHVFHAAELTTDEEGRWRWDGAPKDLSPLYISARHVDYMDGQARIQDGVDNKIVLNQGLKVEGQVADREGKPIVGIAVRLGFDRFGTNAPATTTDAEGKFLLTKCKAGRSLVTVQGSGFAPKLQELVVGEKSGPLEFVLEPGHTIRMRVVDADGKPLPGAMMAPDTWRGHRSLELRLTTDAEGMASWDSAPDDDVLWDFFKQGYMSTRKKSLAPADEVHVVTLFAPLVISGKVTDAASGKAIEKFTISEGTLFENSRQLYWSRSQGNEFADGEYTFKFHEPAAGRALKVLASGYQPEISRTFKSDEGNQTFDFQLKPGSGPAGIVLLPDGQPAADADVGLATRSRRGMLQQGRFDGRQNQAEVVRTDARGRFQFSALEDKSFLLIALHDEGFAEVLSADFEKSDQIRLSPWGQLEGRVLLGDVPDADREVVFHPQRPDSQNTYEYIFQYGYAAKTDREGRFHFDRVIPGPGSMTRSIVIEHGRGSSHHFGWNTPVEVKPNESTTVQIGGVGRPVTGRIRLKQPTDVQIDWTTNDLAEIYAVSRDRRQRTRTSGRYMGPLLKSGRFRIPDVPPGEYEISIPVNVPPKGEGFGQRTVIGRARRQFTIPEIPGGRTNAPLDLGEIEAYLFDTLDPGEVAPDFTAKLLDGSQTRLREHHGQLVLLDFWMASNPQSVAEFPDRRKLHARFSENPRFYFLGLSCDYNDGMARQFVEKEALGWPQAHVGAFHATVPQLYTVREVPASFLIGPNGKVLAKNLRRADLEKAIADALADEALFAAAGEPPPRYPLTTFEGVKERATPAGLAAIILGDIDPAYERELPHDDHLRGVNAAGDVLWEVGGLRTSQGGGAQRLAVDPKRNRIFVAENLGQHLSAFNGAGERLWRTDSIPAACVAVDAATGHVWVSFGWGTESPATVIFDRFGRELQSMPVGAFDMAHDTSSGSFWLVSDKLQNFGPSQSALFSKPLEESYGMSVAVNPRDGSVWIADRDSLNRQKPRNRLRLFSSRGEVRRELEVEGDSPAVVACHPETGDAWFCGFSSGLRRVGAEGPISPVLVEEARNVSISPTTGDLWVGTEEGCLRIDPQGKELARTSFARPCSILGLRAY